MPLVNKDTYRIWKRHSRQESLIHWFITTGVLLLFFISFRVISANTLWVFVLDAPKQGWDILTRMIPPELSYAGKLWQPLWDTIVIASFGTLGAIIIAFPVAFFAAKNTSPAGGIFRPVALLLIVTSRSINSLAWAIMLVTILGPGILAGILAITLRSIGFVSKLLYEAIEEIDYRQVEAVRSTGAYPLQVLRIGVLPQIMPAFTSISMYRWDINIRESTVLGLVGAGGIGLQLQASINVLAWRRVAVILLLILGTVVISELITARVRKNLL